MFEKLFDIELFSNRVIKIDENEEIPFLEEALNLLD